ncbi:MAG: acetyl-coenzyme A synthetase N-terminal domain-containing protein, partial [Paracoccaceae bacterium]|nr:acetyl-coenzyme A synthetase N-terminal domain-containing protein [Paracoccaceae bacterium]
MTIHDATPAAPGLQPVPAAFAASAHVGSGAYDDLYAASVSDPEGFWAEQARRVDWIK